MAQKVRVNTTQLPPFPITNETGDDFSEEIVIQLAVAMYSIWASEIICYKVADTCDEVDQENTFFQTKKQHFRRGRQLLQQVIREFEVAFDVDFNKIFNRNAPELHSADRFMEMANYITQLLLVFLSKGDGDDAKIRNMIKALKNFKPNPDVNLESIMKYYNFKD